MLINMTSVEKNCLKNKCHSFDFEGSQDGCLLLRCSRCDILFHYYPPTSYFPGHNDILKTDKEFKRYKFENKITEELSFLRNAIKNLSPLIENNIKKISIWGLIFGRKQDK